MAGLPRGLCLLLSLWMVGSRPSADIQTGSPASSLRWSQQAKQKFQDDVLALRQNGNYASLEARYQAAYADALGDGDLQRQVRFRMGVGSARFARFDYPGALEAFLDARRLARQGGFPEDLEAASFNLSSLYQPLWDLDSSLEAAEEGRQAGASVVASYSRPQLLLHTARLRAALEIDPRDLVASG